MDTNTQQRKMTRYFNDLDADGDGFLEEKDLALVVDRFCTHNGYAEDSSQSKQLLELCLGLWREVIAPMDANGDGKVTLVEMTASFHQQQMDDPGGFATAISSIAEQFFAMCDADRDGWITEDEWVALFSPAARVPEAECREAFRGIDTDGSGGVSRQEYQKAVMEFFTGSDPAAPGNRIFGRI